MLVHVFDLDLPEADPEVRIWVQEADLRVDPRKTYHGAERGRRPVQSAVTGWLFLWATGSVHKRLWGAVWKDLRVVLLESWGGFWKLTCQLPLSLAVNSLGVQATLWGRWALACSLQAEWKVFEARNWGIQKQWVWRESGWGLNSTSHSQYPPTWCTCYIAIYWKVETAFPVGFEVLNKWQHIEHILEQLAFSFSFKKSPNVLEIFPYWNLQRQIISFNSAIVFKCLITPIDLFICPITVQGRRKNIFPSAITGVMAEAPVIKKQIKQEKSIQISLVFYVTQEPLEMKSHRPWGNCLFLWTEVQKCNWRAEGSDLVVTNCGEVSKACLFGS